MISWATNLFLFIGFIFFDPFPLKFNPIFGDNIFNNDLPSSFYYINADLINVNLIKRKSENAVNGSSWAVAIQWDIP